MFLLLGTLAFLYHLKGRASTKPRPFNPWLLRCTGRERLPNDVLVALWSCWATPRATGSTLTTTSHQYHVYFFLWTLDNCSTMSELKWVLIWWPSKSISPDVHAERPVPFHSKLALAFAKHTSIRPAEALTSTSCSVNHDLRWVRAIACSRYVNTEILAVLFVAAALVSCRRALRYALKCFKEYRRPRSGEKKKKTRRGGPYTCETLKRGEARFAWVPFSLSSRNCQ